MLRFETAIPNLDSSGNFVNFSSLQSSMEPIATDGFTHGGVQDNIFQSGSYVEQRNVFHWHIDDTNLSAANSNFNTFVAIYTWTHSPQAHSWAIS